MDQCAGNARAPRRRLSRLLAEYPAPEPSPASGSTREPTLPAPPRGHDAPAQWAGTLVLGTDESARAWLAAYLGGFPEHAAIPRWQLRDAATAWWPVLGKPAPADPGQAAPARRGPLRLEQGPPLLAPPRQSPHGAGGPRPDQARPCPGRLHRHQSDRHAPAGGNSAGNALRPGPRPRWRRALTSMPASAGSLRPASGMNTRCSVVGADGTVRPLGRPRSAGA